MESSRTCLIRLPSQESCIFSPLIPGVDEITELLSESLPEFVSGSELWPGDGGRLEIRECDDNGT